MRRPPRFIYSEKAIRLAALPGGRHHTSTAPPRAFEHDQAPRTRQTPGQGLRIKCKNPWCREIVPEKYSEASICNTCRVEAVVGMSSDGDW